MSQKHKEIIKLILIIIFFYLLLKLLLLPKINSPEFTAFVESVGVYGYLVIISYIVLSHIFAPIAGSPGVILGVTIYGLKTGMWLLYFASMISAVINFQISHSFGRRYIRKLVGKDSMQKIDDYTKVEGKQVLLLSRFFGFALFDFISYAAGLTNIKFRDYFLITASVQIVVTLAVQLIFKNLDFQSERGIVIWLGSIFITGVVFSLMTNHYIKKHKS